MLTLTTRFSPAYNDNDNECHQLLQFYSNTARTLVMLRVANGTVDLETIESLCLLAYSFFIDGNAFLGRFHLGFAFQLCCSAMIDVQASSYCEKGNAHTERKKRLFWSLVSLEQCYGQQEHNHGNPVLPRDDNNTGDSIDIWTLAIHFGWVWSRVRTYVSDCAQNKLKEPWRYDSMYAMILSDLTEVENKLSQCHRYDSVKFYARTAEDVLLNRDYWGPWLKLQFTYHCILTMLNHPFLYIVASQHYPNLAIPNAFWRRSSELALLHATWIVRIIDMVSEKKVCLIDPFFGHAAAVAATVHLYYCRAADPRLKFKSKIDLAKCRRFLEGFVSFSPACRALDATLEKILRVAFGSENVDYDWTPSRIYLSVPLMWDILRATPNLSESETRDTPGGAGGPLHPSLIPTPTTIQEKENPSTTEPSHSTLEIIVAISPEVTVNTADGGQAAHMPPNMPSSSSASHQQTTPSSAPNLSSSPSPFNTSMSVDIGGGGDRLVAPNDHLMMNTPWLWTDPAQVPAPEMGNMNREELENAVGNVDGLLSWWDIGNL